MNAVLRRLFPAAPPRCSRSHYNMPTSANAMPRAGGIASFMRLPIQNTASGLDACFLGIPFDCGTSNRAGTRFGPRQIRGESALLRPANADTGAAPFESLQVADVGDVPCTIYDMKQALEDIRKFVSAIHKVGCLPLAIGGDHTITFPLLQAAKEKHGAVGLIHVDAHSDTNDTMMGCRLAHGTPFRRAVEEGLLDCQRVVQIGIRGTRYTPQDNEWPDKQSLYFQGFWMVPAHQCWHKSLTPLMDKVRKKMGGGPVYVSLDIDALDPAYAPGTGTPEIAGLTPIQMLEIIRGCRHLNIIGGDLVEVSPPYDPSGNTALTAANLLFELLCSLPKVKYHGQ